jgi:hypothetical protein
MIKRETLEPIEKDDIINILVEFRQKIEKHIDQMREDIDLLKEENRQLKQTKNSRNSSIAPSHDFGRVPNKIPLRDI